MDYLEFLFCLKAVAIRTGLRLFHNIPPAGCGWMFYFKDDETGRCSDYYVWFEKHETPEELFVNLVSFGEKFKESLKEESAGYGVKQGAPRAARDERMIDIL